MSYFQFQFILYPSVTVVTFSRTSGQWRRFISGHESNENRSRKGERERVREKERENQIRREKITREGW